MAEALISFQDQLPSSDPNYKLRYRAGEIITIQQDGWPWSDAELTNPQWRIIKAPGLDANAIQAWLAASVDVNNNLLMRRSKFLDTTKIPNQISKQLQTNQTLTLTAAQVSTLSSWISNQT